MKMNTYNRRLVLNLFCVSTFLFILLTLSSCSSSKETAYKYQAPTKEEEIIDNHVANNDIEALIHDYFLYPDYNVAIANYLLNDIDYSDTDYSGLLHYQEIAEEDTILANGFRAIIIEREEQILDLVSDMPIDGIAHYYKAHLSEQSFLGPVLCDAFLKIIDTLQYPEIKKIYTIFSSTDIGDSIEPHYLDTREAIKPMVTKSYNEYCSIEKEITKYYKEKAKEELDLYIANHLEAFIEDIFDKDLPKNKNKVKEKFDTSFDMNFSKRQMVSIVELNIQELILVINSGRSDFLNELSDSGVYSDLYLIPIEDFQFNTNLTKEMDIQDLYKISEIQNRRDWLGITLGVASFFTGGWAGLALSALDIIHGVKDVKGKASEVMPFIKSFIAKTQDYIENISTIYISRGFSSYETKNAKSSSSFKNTIYEVY